ncbi:MAG: phytase [Chlorobiota bacterium]
MKNMIKITVLAAFLAFTSCKNEGKVEKQAETVTQKEQDKSKETDYIVISEDAVSEWDDNDNIDSPAFFNEGDKEYIIATSKHKDFLQIYDANDLSKVKKLGKEEGYEFSRPNGIWVIDDLALVVERDNQRVQVLTVPDFKSVGFIGEKELKKPYGLSVHKIENGYSLFVTDDYESDDEVAPTNNKILDERVKEYVFDYKNGKLTSKYIRSIGETNGEGRLFVVESIFADPENNVLLIADESNLNKNIKIYDINSGKFIKSIGSGQFIHQVEGIALYDCGNGDGFWFATDQSKGDNTVHVFERKSINYLTSFKTKTTQNTDGVWLTQNEFEGHDDGIFIMVHDDGGVSKFDLEKLFSKLEIKCN